MNYRYLSERPRLVRENMTLVLSVLRESVAYCMTSYDHTVTVEEVMWSRIGGWCDSWQLLAAFDYLVEQGQLWELTGPHTPGQYRRFAVRRA